MVQWLDLSGGEGLCRKDRPSNYAPDTQGPIKEFPQTGCDKTQEHACVFQDLPGYGFGNIYRLTLVRIAIIN